jgi:hypothetical protein
MAAFMQIGPCPALPERLKSGWFASGRKSRMVPVSPTLAGGSLAADFGAGASNKPVTVTAVRTLPPVRTLLNRMATPLKQLASRAQMAASD